jgi:hypothetical protein
VLAPSPNARSILSFLHCFLHCVSCFSQYIRAAESKRGHQRHSIRNHRRIASTTGQPIRDESHGARNERLGSSRHLLAPGVVVAAGAVQRVVHVVVEGCLTQKKHPIPHRVSSRDPCPDAVKFTRVQALQAVQHSSKTHSTTYIIVGELFVGELEGVGQVHAVAEILQLLQKRQHRSASGVHRLARRTPSTQTMYAHLGSVMHCGAHVRTYLYRGDVVEVDHARQAATHSKVSKREATAHPRLRTEWAYFGSIRWYSPLRSEYTEQRDCWSVHTQYEQPSKKCGYQRNRAKSVEVLHNICALQVHHYTQNYECQNVRPY